MDWKERERERGAEVEGGGMVEMEKGKQEKERRKNHGVLCSNLGIVTKAKCDITRTEAAMKAECVMCCFCHSFTLSNCSLVMESIPPTNVL